MADYELRKHDKYYFPDGNVVFLVEKTLYRVYRYPLQKHSRVFETMFSLPQDAEHSTEGTTDMTPILLDGVQKVELDALLSVICPAEVLLTYKMSGDAYRHMLAAAHRWDAPAAKELAIDQLEAQKLLSPIERIVFGRRFDLPWLHVAFVDICMRDEPLIPKEARDMVHDDAIWIAWIREKARIGKRPRSQLRSVVSGYVEEKLGLAAPPDSVDHNVNPDYH